MLETYELFEHNIKTNKERMKIINGKCIYQSRPKKINFNELTKIVSWFDRVEKTHQKIPIIFDFRKSEFADKLSYIIFECICQYIISQGYKVTVGFYNYINNIWLVGLEYSPLKLLWNNSRKNREIFLKRFEFNIERAHYRKVITKESNTQGEAVSILMTEIEEFLRNLFVRAEYAREISEVLSELVDNALEHSQSDCLIDIDVTNDFAKSTDPDGNYRGINIAIVNFSEKLLGQDIEYFLETGVKNQGYDKLGRAKISHEPFWNGNYKKEDFFIMAAFQRTISSRSMDYLTGGTGLTKLIASLEKRSDAYECYVVSGNRVLKLKHKFLDFDDDEWVGFNTQRDFVNYPPDFSNIKKSDLFIPGTAFNLNFVVKKENDNV